MFFSRKSKGHHDYRQLFRALGEFIEEHKLSEVAVLEFDRGIVISGLALEQTVLGWERVPRTYTLSYEELTGRT